MSRVRPTAPEATDPEAHQLEDAALQTAAALDTSDPIDPIREALAQLGSDGGAYVLVHKLEQQGSVRDWAYCVRFQVGSFDIDAIRDQFKGGTYRAKFIRSNGKCFKQATFLIAASAPSAAPAPSHASTQGHQVVGAAPSSLVEQLVLKSFEQTGTLLAAIVTAIAGGGGGIKGADLIAAVREGREGATGGKSGLAETMEAIRMGAELGGGATAADNDPLLAVAGPLMSLLERMLSRPAGATSRPSQPILVPGRTSPAPLARPAAPETTPAHSSTLAPPPVDAEPFLKLARAYLPMMLREAVSKRDGYTWGRYMTERTKPAFRPHLEMLAAAEPAERMSLLTSLEPAFAQHAEWVEEAAEGILDVLHPEDETTEEETDANPGSNLTDGSADGGGGRNGDSARDAADHPPAGGILVGEGARGAP